MSRGIAGRVLSGWRDPARSWRDERNAGLGEGRLLALAYGATLFLTLGRVGAEFADPKIAAGEERTAWLAATVFIGFSFGVLALYAVSSLAKILCRLAGGGGSWAETRLALFWSGLVAGPVAATLHIIAAAVIGGAFAGAAASFLWACLFAPMLAAAHGLRAWTIFAAFGAIALCLGAMALALG